MDLKNDQNKKEFGVSPSSLNRDLDVGTPTGVSGVLARLWRIIQNDIGMNGYKWDYLMEEHLRHEVRLLENKRRDKERRNPELPVANHAELNRRDRTSIRGNLNKELKRKSMTWKVFCKAMVFLKVKKIRIVIQAEHSNGRITEHSTVVALGSAALMELQDDTSQNAESTKNPFDPPSQPEQPTPPSTEK